jgi:arylsulfatase A-like enzyme
MNMQTRHDFLKLLAAACLLAALPDWAQEAAKPPAKRPNILFAIADDWSYGHAGAYGCKWVKTPAFDRVAKDGLLFTRAYTPTAKCAPSRAGILTGRNPWQLKEAANHWCYFPAEFKTYPEALGNGGYFVGMTGKGWAPGVAKDANGKPRQMTGVPFLQRKENAPTKAISNNDYAGNFEEFLAAAPAGQPWCFWYGGLEPHRDYEYGSGVAKGGKQTADLDRVPGYWPDEPTVRNDMLDYAFETEHFDRHLGRMLALLEKRGELDNTLIIVTSDNGMPFPHCKGNTYPDSNHLPLAIMWKNRIRSPGRVAEEHVSLIDLAPTIIEAAGLNWEQTGLAPATGHSLADVFAAGKTDGPIPSRDHVIIGRERNDFGRPLDQGYPVRGIVKGDFVYLHNFEPDRWPACNPETGYMDTDGSPTKTAVLKTRHLPEQKRHWELCFGMRPREELYNLRIDPDCLANRAVETETCLKLREQLFAELKQQGDPRMFGQGHLFDDYPNADKSRRGFYERFINKQEKIEAGWIDPTDVEKGTAPKP